MNTRIALSAALAAGIFFAAAPMQAQAPALSNTQKLEVKIADLQAQVNALQAQLKRLQAEVRVLAPRRGATPIDQIPLNQLPLNQLPLFQAPNFPGQGGFGGGENFVPNRQIQPFQAPGLVPAPDIEGRPLPYNQPLNPQLLVPRLYSNIPPCTITLIN